jgi:hypothetical protein
LASSRDTRNGPDLQDVLSAMMAFEGINSVRLVLHLLTEKVGQTVVLRMEVEAWERPKESTAPLLLASSSVRIGSSDRRTVDAALLQLMYKLDAVLATGEFSKLTNK